MKLDSLFTATTAVSLQAYLQAPQYVNNVASDKLRIQIAAHIGEAKVIKTEHAHHVEFRLK